MSIHPKLLELLDNVGHEDVRHPPTAEAWERILNGMSRMCAEAEQNQFLLDQTLDTLDQSSQRLETKVGEEREKLQSLLAAIQDGVCAIDRQGRILFVNPAAERFFGCDPTGDSDFSLLDLLGMTDDDPKSTDEVLEKISSGETLRNDDATLCVDETTQLPVSYIFSPIVRGDVIVGAVCVIRDVTEQKEAADRL